MKLIIEEKQEFVGENTGTENYEITDYKCECGSNLVKKEIFFFFFKYWYGYVNYFLCTNRYFLENNGLKKF